MAAGTTNFPTSVDTWVDHSLGDAYVGESHTTMHNNEQAAIIALQNRLGFGSATSAASISMRGVEWTFTETSGSGVYTASIVLPAGSYVWDIIVHGTAVWNNAGTAVLKIGDTDDDCFFTDVELKSTELIAAEGLSLSGGTGLAGGVVGADVANSQWNRRYLSTARTISAIITTSSTGGTTGRTRVIVLWLEPATTPTAATKV